MRLLIAAAITAALALVGCATVKYNGSETQAEMINEPVIGKVATAQVGDYLIRKGLMVQEQALVIPQRVEKATYQIPGGTYKQVGDDNKYWFYANVGSGGMVTWNSFLSDAPHALAVPKAGPPTELCVIAGMGSKVCYTTGYERKTVMSAQAQSFQQTLLYNGRVGNKINIGYREFSNDMARPAYNNEVEYDLSESNTISYKGAQLEVIDANNNGITYRVLSSFP